ncbi:MAG: sporulation initiation inhibitor Soj [Fimbriimonadales bacterium]|nr:Sporulation initiation inhibitor protein Soj [bacterium HR14]GIV12108.1 MAG: sporulation initiation inhibitor Soj [Fimbriimonadales bacterium]
MPPMRPKPAGKPLSGENPLHVSQHCRVLAVVNQKGGVGKTTTAVNLSAGLATTGDTVLLIDADPQANATSGLGVAEREYTLFDLFQEEATPEQVITETGRPNLWLIPASIDLAGIDVLFASRIARETILKQILQPLRERFQWIIVDTPPSLGLLTINALTAADGLIIPLQCEYYALEGLTQLMRTIELVRQHLNPNLTIWKVLLTMYDTRTRLAEQVESEVRKFFGTKVAQTVIPRNVRIGESPSFGQPVIEYDPRSRGAHAYLEFVKEVREYGASRSG